MEFVDIEDVLLLEEICSFRGKLAGREAWIQELVRMIKQLNTAIKK
jgi:hypothetical protein